MEFQWELKTPADLLYVNELERKFTVIAKLIGEDRELVKKVFLVSAEHWETL